MITLAFDTSTEVLSICLVNGENVCQYESLKGLKHGKSLMPGIARILKDAGLSPDEVDLIVCSRGPGSFTGLRIGMTTAKGLSAGTGAPVVSVDTLDGLAYPLSFFSGAVVPVVDARKSRYYTAVYHRGRRLTKQLDCTVEELVHLTDDFEQVLLTGPGARQLSTPPGMLRTGVATLPGPMYGTAHSLAVLGVERFHTEGPDSPEQGPVYIRLSDAELYRK